MRAGKISIFTQTVLVGKGEVGKGYYLASGGICFELVFL